jgi:Protein of unknown function (DUF2892)
MTMLEKNVGGMDRVVRFALGFGLIMMVFFDPKTPWGWLGIIPFATALFRTCPIYSILGMDTCSYE